MKKTFFKFISLVIATALLVTICSCAKFNNNSATIKRQHASKQSVSSQQSSEVQSVQSIDAPSQVIQSQNNQSAQSNLQSNVQSASSIDSSLNITSSDIISSQLPNSSYINTSSQLQSDNKTSSNNNSLVNTSSNTVSTQKKYEFPFKAGLYIISDGPGGSWTSFSTNSYLADEETYENIKSQGFDHVKLLTDFGSMYSASDKSLNEKYMSALDEILDIIENQGLYVFIYAYWKADFDTFKDLDAFVTVWELIAQRYKDRSELVYFALMDEPKTTDINKLNTFLTPAVEAIRKTNPTRKIVCPAADGNQAWLLEEYRPPVTNDDNLILAIHTFSPAEFTHQGCTWAGQNKGQVRLTQEHKDTLNWDLEQVQKFMRYSVYRDIPVIINAFGLNLSLANEEDASEFIRIITQFCKDNNMPWALWSYNNGDFSIYKEGSFFSEGSWNQSALDALFLR